MFARSQEGVADDYTFCEVLRVAISRRRDVRNCPSDGIKRQARSNLPASGTRIPWRPASVAACNKDDALLPSGLLGPVQVRVGRLVEITR